MKQPHLRVIAGATRIKGLSLVELMIAMTLGLAIISAVGWVYLGTTKTFRTQDSIARLQEGARYAFEVIGNDLRMTGATGCGATTHMNVLTNFSTNWSRNLFEQPLLSAEQDGVAGTTEFSDALSVLHADVSREYVVQSHNSGGAQFTVSSHDLSQGGFLVATDCSHVSVFQASAATSPSVSHAATGANSTASLGAGGVPYTYPAGARLYRLSAATYYVADNPAGQPSLYRQRLAADGTLTAEELIEGVEDFQVAFGVDTDATPDGAANFDDPDGDGDPYLTGSQVDTATVPGVSEQERWARVVSIRISLLMRTVENGVVPSAQTYNYNGADVTADDLRLRRVFTHVIKLRNR